MVAWSNGVDLQRLQNSIDHANLSHIKRRLRLGARQSSRRREGGRVTSPYTGPLLLILARFITMVMKKLLSSLPAMVAIMLAIAMLFCSVVVVHSSEVKQANDATRAHLEGSHQGVPPPAPQGGRVHAYGDVPPPPQLSSLSNSTRTGRTDRLGGDINSYVTDRHV
ncbi:hypothetical protein ZEAMMB73_Zm00001d040100 [Zea mays]|uniref:Uncharacterized protein n=2 Tax=Zea mays TaxID=4577 RepID=A0A1D6MN35_MAIZE|nr:hypothetical protein ZEAMMB73_Zm00001d040100 [Zea mays]